MGTFYTRNDIYTAQTVYLIPLNLFSKKQVLLKCKKTSNFPRGDQKMSHKTQNL